MFDSYHLQFHEREIKDNEEITTILERGKYISIAMCRENLPYLVTLSYGYDKDSDTLYFHSRTDGLKLDILQTNPDVCATVIADLGYHEGRCEHAYRSVVLYGTMSVVNDPQEKEHGMRTLLHHLETDAKQLEQRYLQSSRFLQQTVVIKLIVTNKRGKAGQ